MDYWSKLEDIFAVDDGSLPDIEFDVQTADGLARAYEVVQSWATHIVSSDPYYWSSEINAPVTVEFDDNPSELVSQDKAEPFHLVFGGIRTPAGHTVPPLGVYIFQETIALDYRMGEGWSRSALIGLFEILAKISVLVGSEFRHQSNLNDHEGDRLLTAWRTWRDRRET